MDMPQILAIILLSMDFCSGVFLDGKLKTISFEWRTFSVIIWILILYNGGFWN